MQTIGTIIQRIITLYNKGVNKLDSELSPVYVYNIMLTIRNVLYTQKSKKNQKLNSLYFQLLNCVKLIEVNKQECPCILPINCKVYRTELPIPIPLSNLNKHLIKNVTSIEGSIIFDETNWTQLKYNSGLKYTNNINKYYFRNGYIYFITNQSSKYVAIEGIFQDPIAAIKYGNSCAESSTNCESYFDYIFPIDNDLIEPLIKMVFSEIIVFLQNKDNISNNSQDDNRVEE